MNTTLWIIIGVLVVLAAGALWIVAGVARVANDVMDEIMDSKRHNYKQTEKEVDNDTEN